MAIFVTSGNDQQARQRLAQLLKELRGTKTQREFAKQIGTSYTALQDWEKQVRLPREKNLNRIAELLGWPQDELLRFLFLEEAQLDTASSASRDCLENPLQKIFSQVKALTLSQKQALRDYLHIHLSNLEDGREIDMTSVLSDQQKHNLHLLLRASLKGQSPTDAMVRAGIPPELFTDLYLRNDKNRLVDFDSLQKLSSLCCRVIEWRGDQPPEIDCDRTYQGNTSRLFQELAEPSRSIHD